MAIEGEDKRRYQKEYMAKKRMLDPADLLDPSLLDPVKMLDPDVRPKLSDSDRSSGYLCGSCKMRYTNSWRLGFRAGRGLSKKDVLDMPDVGTDCVRCGGQHKKGWDMGISAGREAGPVARTYPNYDINPAHKEGCNCGVCSGEFDKGDAVKQLKKVVRG